MWVREAWGKSGRFHGTALILREEEEEEEEEVYLSK